MPGSLTRPIQLCEENFPASTTAQITIAPRVAPSTFPRLTLSPAIDQRGVYQQKSGQHPRCHRAIRIRWQPGMLSRRQLTAATPSAPPHSAGLPPPRRIPTTPGRAPRSVGPRCAGDPPHNVLKEGGEHIVRGAATASFQWALKPPGDSHPTKPKAPLP